MRIRRFEAPTIQEALQKVKLELGPEAVILYTKKVRKGGFFGLLGSDAVEVTAGLDASAESIAPTAATASRAGSYLADPVAVGLGLRTQSANIPRNPTMPLSPPAMPAPNRRNEILQSELNDGKVLSNAPRQIVRGPEPNRHPDWHPELGRIEKNLIANGVEPDLTKSLLERVNREILDQGYPRAGSLGQLVKRHLCNNLKVGGPVEMVSGKTRVIAFIGPTGVGKTTSLVKLASQYSLLHNAKVALITADTYRIGAVEQLKIYRDIIDIPFASVNKPAELEETLRKFSDCDLVFFDTAGRSPQNKKQIQELRNFLEAAEPAETNLVLSATTKNADLLPIVGKFGMVPINRFLFTKLDETRSYGLIYNLASNFSIPVSYIATGQNVPNDIEVATSERLAELVIGEGLGRPS